jgi:glutamine amidotransferase
MIAVIDYGAGNVRSVVNAFDAIDQNPHLTNDPDKLAKASAIVLPGVGAFGDCMNSLKKLDLIKPLNELVIEQKKPYLGICLGMQSLAEIGYEHGDHQGLGWIKGKCKRLSSTGRKFRIPHMGWNDIEYGPSCPLFRDMPERPVFYFVHSYHLVPNGKDFDTVTATCWHGTKVTAAVQKENIFGTQFHPEKSQENGLQLLKNFLKLI